MIFFCKDREQELMREEGRCEKVKKRKQDGDEDLKVEESKIIE